MWGVSLMEKKKKKCPVHKDTRCYCTPRPDFFKQEQTEFERQQEEWFNNNCQGNIEDY